MKKDKRGLWCLLAVFLVLIFRASLPQASQAQNGHGIGMNAQPDMTRDSVFTAQPQAAVAGSLCMTRDSVFTAQPQAAVVGSLCTARDSVFTAAVPAASVGRLCTTSDSAFTAQPLTDAAEDTASGLPARYDARQEGKNPVIRSQGDRNTCWALTAVSALEAALLPKQRVVFSAEHMISDSGFCLSPDESGDYKMIMAYLTGWYGPVTEEEDPYGSGPSTDVLPARVHVKGLRLLQDADRETWKEQILACGPVQTSLYMDRSLIQDASLYYDSQTYGYYVPQKKMVTHDVLVLGWDDDYPAENFSITAPEDGAWICQNTWGEDFGDKGIFYVSYADANITGQGLVYTAAENADASERIAQNDVCGWQGRIGYGADSCYMAGVFTAQEGETLSGIGFYSLSESTDYTVYLVGHFENVSSFDQKVCAGSGSLTGKGFHAVHLDSARILDGGERFAVVVYLQSPGEDKPVAVEVKKDSYTADVSLEGRETYLSADGLSWESTQDRYAANVCLKAYLKH